MSEAQLRVARRDGLVVFRLEGELRHLLADALERSIDLELQPGLRRLVIDLSGATFMDSTLIGMLVLAARRAAEHSDSPPLLVCAQGELWQQLTELHLDTLFQRVEAPPESLPETHSVDLAEVDDAKAQAALVLKAHRALIQHDPRNADTFASLVSMLEAELATGSDAGGAGSALPQGRTDSAP